MKYYREVKCSDRLPNNDNDYMIYVIASEQRGRGQVLRRDVDRWYCSSKCWHNHNRNNVIYWLEPIELPSEEEVKDKIELLLAAHLTLIDENGRDGSWPQKHIAKRSFEEKKQAIINLLK